MKHTLRLSEYRAMNATERDSAVAWLIAATRSAPNGEDRELAAQIQAYEQRYEMTSDEMIASINNGSLRENDEVCDWLILLKLRSHIEARIAQSAHPPKIAAPPI